MRTTLDIETDVLNTAKALAAAWGVSVGTALSELARRGIDAKMPLDVIDGFPVFRIPVGTPGFGLEDVKAATDLEDWELGREILLPTR